MDIPITIACLISGMTMDFDVDITTTFESLIRDLQAECSMAWPREKEGTGDFGITIDGRPEAFNSIRKTTLFDAGVSRNTTIHLHEGTCIVGAGCLVRYTFTTDLHHTFNGPWGGINEAGDACYPFASLGGRQEDFFQPYIDISLINVTIHAIIGDETYTITAGQGLEQLLDTPIIKLWESMGSGFKSHQLWNCLLIFHFSGAMRLLEN